MSSQDPRTRTGAGQMFISAGGRAGEASRAESERAVRRRGRAATRQLTFIVLGALLLFTGVGGFVAVQAGQHAEGVARADAAFQADLGAHAIADALTLGSSTLTGIAAGFPTEEVIATPGECQLLFSGLGPFPHGHIDIVLPDGQVICSSAAAKGAPAGATQAGAAWVSKGMQAKSVLVSAPFDDQLTGSRAIALVQPLSDASQVPIAMIALVVTLPDLAPGLDAIYGGPRGFSFAVSANGATLSGATPSARPGSREAPLRDAAQLGASAPVAGLGWRVQASASQATILAPTRSLLLKGAAFAGAALLLAVLLLVLIYRWIAHPLDRLAATETKLQVSEERLRLLLNGARDYAIVMLEPDGRVASWSASAELLDGYSEEQARGLDYAAFFTPEEASAGRAAQILQSAAATGRDEHEGARVRRDGTRYWARSVVTARFDNVGELTSFVTVTHDATIRREAEQTIVRMNEELEQRVLERTAQLEAQTGQLQAANTELEAFSYSVSHDLRAPLRAINNFASVLSTGFADDLPEDARKYLQRIQNNGETLTEMVNALLSLSATQRIPLRIQDLDIETLTREAWADLACDCAARVVDLSVHTLPSASGDPRLIRQVMANLLGNALKYTGRRERAIIEVDSRIEAGETIFYVRDNGTGFDMRNADRLFQVFQRLHSATDFPGTGIGLASVNRIITRHGGRVWAESTPEHGATFYFTLTTKPELVPTPATVPDPRDPALSRSNSDSATSSR